jgi:hypothetical protein
MRITSKVWVMIVTLVYLPVGARAQSGARPQQAVPAPALPRRSALAPASDRMLQLARDGHLLQAGAVGRQYVALTPGAARTAEHCKVLVQLAYTEFMLERRDPAKVALTAFDRACGSITVPPEFRAEAKRVHRVLAGEPVATVYPERKP